MAMKITITNEFEHKGVLMKKLIVILVALAWLLPAFAEDVVTIDFEEFVGVSPLVPLSSKGYSFRFYNKPVRCGFYRARITSLLQISTLN
jgi:hypothetical protein